MRAVMMPAIGGRAAARAAGRSAIAGRSRSAVRAASGADAPPAASTSGGAAPAPAPGATDSRFAGLRVAVAGATGGTGSEVVAALRARGVPARAIVRDASKAAARLPPAGEGLTVATGDVTNYTTLAAALGDANALIVATGARDPADPLSPLNVDFNGTLNLIEAAKRAGVTRFVLVSSIGADELLNPLNLFWGVLLWKKQAELALARSGLTFTVVRPGGLKSGPGEGAVVMARAGTWGFPPFKASGAIARSQVAEVCVEALVCDAAANKVVEVIAQRDAPSRAIPELFAGV